jgi:hypothetical protein
MIIRGVDQTLDISWYVENSLITTVTSATLTLKQGSTVLLDEVAATTLGGSTSATYDLTAAEVPDTLSFSDTMLEIWTLTGTTFGTPATVTTRRSGHLVRTILYPLIHDADLVNRHRRIEDIRPPSITNFSSYRDLAWEILNRDLIKKGRRPSLILSSFALVDAHVYKSLELIFRDAITFVGDGRYSDLATMYAEAYREEWQEIQFVYDRDENDAIDPGEKEAASPSVFFGVPPGFPSYTVKGY